MRAPIHQELSLFSRRRFLAATSALTAGSFWLPSRIGRAEPPPETRTIRVLHQPATVCLAPQYLAEELLRIEGFSEVKYVEPVQRDYDPVQSVGAGGADISMDGAPSIVPRIDAGLPVVALAGVHAGCYELLGNERVRSIRDLKGKIVAVWAMGATDHVFVSAMAAYVGVDPRREIRWLVAPENTDPMGLFVDGKADAFLGFAPEPQQVRAKRVGHVVLDTAQDRPWSQYFCCMVTANREFLRQNPIATKRALRAILKAADICSNDPERVARFLVAKGYQQSYERRFPTIDGEKLIQKIRYAFTRCDCMK